MLRVSSEFTEDFAVILKEEWAKRTGDETHLLRKLSADLRERREAEQKLLLKYLHDDQRMVPFFDSMNRSFEEDIAAIEFQIAEVGAQKATFEQLWRFSKRVLVDIPTAWRKATIAQKQRVQNVLFPEGLEYHPEKVF